MELRLATIDDVDGLFELCTLFFDGFANTKERMRRSLEDSGREVVCVAFEGALAVGFCIGLIIKSVCYANPRGEIEVLYVRDEFRGKGVGLALMSFTEERLRSLGINHFHLTTDTNNLNAQRLYEKLGFEKTGEILYDK